MNKDNPRQGEGLAPFVVPEGAPDVVSVADWLFGQSAEALMNAVIDIQSGDYDDARDMGALITALRKALEAVLHERARIDRIARASGGAGAGDGAAGGVLDLGAARAEIRRRMDRLRAAAGEAGVSGKPE